MPSDMIDTTLRAEATAHGPLWARDGRLGIELDAETGLLAALLQRNEEGVERRLPLRLNVVLEAEGREVEGHPFGLAYEDTERLADVRPLNVPVTHDLLGPEDVFTVVTEMDGWRLNWGYRFRAQAPRLEIDVTVSSSGGDEPATLRNMVIGLAFTPDQLADWRVQAPGAPMRPGVSATELTQPARISDAVFSGSGMVVLDHPDTPVSVLLWPLPRLEQSVNQLQANGDTLTMTVTTGLAGRIRGAERLHWSVLEFDVFNETWDSLRSQASSWYGPLALTTSADTADWVRAANIYEVQIGTSVFWGGFTYSPYPEMRDLYADLGRIAGLGFTCIQIMPRQPFPSYNVFDYDDVSTSWGDEDDLKRVVEAAHALGMRVILDILMHGVIDAEVIGRTADRVRSGPYAHRLDEGTEVVPDEAFEAYAGQDYLVAWSRHILDFEAHWAGGSPGSHPLADEHPEWFMRDSAGNIIGVYTKAFDVANPDWQRYFTSVALNLMRRLGIDGFRFDAPTYNEFPNWSPATEARASASQLGSVDHFQRLRVAMKRQQPDALLYTEPSGVLFRQSMDLTYNYDEHWLIPAIVRPERELARNPLGIRDARDLAHWFRDKAAALPAGATTARHIDSHDSFWWPLPGFKWRREQYGVPATRALMATWALTGGAYMMFVGGEEQIEADLRRVNRLRREEPTIGQGVADYDGVYVSDAHIFAVLRRIDGATTLVLVNHSRQPVEAMVSLDLSVVAEMPAFRVSDLWNDMALPVHGRFVWNRDDLAGFPVTFDPHGIRVLAFRPLG